jgi:DNA-binding SARP family transcriptional activator/tetratricopeptide (TPR) repeat protein/DNA-binding XRE family transcriptional regulator
VDGQPDGACARLGTSVRKYRRAAGLTQRQLADRSGLSVAAVRDLEQGRSQRPRAGSLTALATVLGVEPGQLTAQAAISNEPAVPSAHGDAPAGQRGELWLTALGPLAASRDGQPVDLGQPMQAAVLGLLAVQPGELVRRETVVGVLWRQHPPDTATDLVQQYVRRLRRILDPGGRDRLIEQGPAWYRLRAGAGQLDVVAFKDLAARAAATKDAATACGLYARALDLWRGEPAADAEVLRDHLAVGNLVQRRADAVLRYADAAREIGGHARVLPLLEALAREDSLDERVHARLMVALAGTGQQAAAIGVFEGLRRRLDEQLGVRPGPEVASAHQQILRQEIPVAAVRSEALASKPGLAAGSRPALGVRYSLPPDTAAFTGRQAEFDRITEAAAEGGGAVIHTISGMPGIGKTALAVHAAHALRDRFPDRQLFLSLHGHAPGQQPVTPEAALAGLLAAVGVDAPYLPGDLEGRAALWRDRMAGQRALFVLDNAASSAQVAPLLPGSAGCLVLITSRRHLGDLPGATTPVFLEALPAIEAREMFTRLAPRAADEPPETVTALAELAGRLPLAISLLARVYARHPSWTLSDLATETRTRMLTLTAEDDSVAAAFEVSYQNLAPGRRDFFRRLGLHPGTVIDGHAAAALADCDLNEAAGHLDALYGEGLLTEAGRHRYSMHDLIRRYARDLAAADPAGPRAEVLERLLDYYQQAAARAEMLLARQARPRQEPPQAVTPTMASAAQALAWARAERASLLACLDHVTATGQHARVVALTAAIASLLRLDGPWSSAIARHVTAVAAARRIGDRHGLGNALTDLGGAWRLTGDHQDAVEALREAQDIFRAAGDRQGQATVLMSLADVWLATGDHQRAITALRTALTIYPDIGSRLGQATALTDLRGVRRLTGGHPDAIEALREAQDIFREAGDAQGQATVLAFLGVVQLAAGDHRTAAVSLQKAHGIYHDIGHLLGTAIALTYLGDAKRLTGDYRDALQALHRAHRIYRDIGHRLGTATALTYLGVARRETGGYRDALDALQEARGIYRDIGDRGGEAMALNETGALHHAHRDWDQAAQCHGRALDLAREIASLWDEAHALAGLGRSAWADGQSADGIAWQTQARDIFQRIGAPEAAVITREWSRRCDREGEQPVANLI